MSSLAFLVFKPDLFYRETPPSSPLVGVVEAFWHLESHGEHVHRVPPDGCSDIVVHFRGGSLLSMKLVGPMTSAIDVPTNPGERFYGIRFHPGMAGAFFDLDLATLRDSSHDLLSSSAWGKAASDAKELPDLTCMDEMRKLMTAMLPVPKSPTRIQSALLQFVDCGGTIPLEQVQDTAGLSDRHFRRECSLSAGLSPKQLQRILRFRRASALLQRGGDLCTVALESGYSDQSHMTREFRALGGMTPLSSIMAGMFKTNSVG